MGILKDLLFGNREEKRPEKTERIDVRGSDERREIHDSNGHWKEEHRWNPHTDRWDKLDIHGDVIGHIEKNTRGDLVHKDYYERVTQVDKREDSRTVSHYDSKGNKTGYTTKDYSNNLTRHTYVEEDKKKSAPGTHGFLNSLLDAAEEYNRKVAEIRRQNETEYDDTEEDEDMSEFEEEYYYSYDPFDDDEDDDDPYSDEYDDDDDYEDDEY